MQLYVADYLGDTRHLTTEQHGAYLLLLMTMWRAGGRLPNEDKKLARITGCTPSRWAKIRDDVVEFFTVTGDEITHKRLMFELEKAQEKSIKRAVSGTQGGIAKSLKDKKADVANATVLPCHSSEPESDSKKDKTTSYPKKDRATRIPDDWMPTPEGVRYAAERGFTELEIENAATEFRRYWLAEGGQRARKVSWHLTWQNNIDRAGERRSRQTARPNPGGNRSKPRSMAQIMLDGRAERGGKPDLSGDGWIQTERDGVFIQGPDGRQPF